MAAWVSFFCWNLKSAIWTVTNLSSEKKRKPPYQIPRRLPKFESVNHSRLHHPYVTLRVRLKYELSHDSDSLSIVNIKSDIAKIGKNTRLSESFLRFETFSEFKWYWVFYLPSTRTKDRRHLIRVLAAIGGPSAHTNPSRSFSYSQFKPKSVIV